MSGTNARWVERALHRVMWRALPWPRASSLRDTNSPPPRCALNYPGLTLLWFRPLIRREAPPHAPGGLLTKAGALLVSSGAVLVSLKSVEIRKNIAQCKKYYFVLFFRDFALLCWVLLAFICFGRSAWEGAAPQVLQACPGFAVTVSVPHSPGMLPLMRRGGC